jgi:hypothetical protein
MKKLFSILSLCVILGSGKPAVVLDIHSAFAAETLKPAAVDILTPVEIKKTFATGKPFSATVPSGKTVQITFNPNGSASSIPKGKKKGIKGKWRLSDAGYCSTWGQRKENCYTVQKVGTRYDVINGNNILAAQWVMDSRSKKE